MRKSVIFFLQKIYFLKCFERYFLFLLVNVVFIFLFASTYWQLVRDLANSPAKIPEKLATALQQGTAKYVRISYDPQLFIQARPLGIFSFRTLYFKVGIPCHS